MPVLRRDQPSNPERSGLAIPQKARRRRVDDAICKLLTDAIVAGRIAQAVETGAGADRRPAEAGSEQ